MPGQIPNVLDLGWGKFKDAKMLPRHGPLSQLGEGNREDVDDDDLVNVSKVKSRASTTTETGPKP